MQAASLPDKPLFRFIDLFAGVGGIRLGFESVGGQCVWTSEWDAYAQKTYLENHHRGHGSQADAISEGILVGDITQVQDTGVIPAYDVLLAGFPCQPFSIAGVSKKNAMGRQHGFMDQTQGTLFFDVARIIEQTRPKAFLLENVKNLRSHDKGRTYEVIMRTLREDLGYHVPEPRIIDARHFVPQHRERIFIAGFREKNDFDFSQLAISKDKSARLGDILHRSDGSEPWIEHDADRFFDHEKRLPQSKYTLTPKLWQFLQDYKAKHQAAGNGFGYGLCGPDDVARTLSARYYKDGSEILIRRGEGQTPRRLTPRECARLMGYPDDFRIPVSDTRAYKQFGNSVVVPVIRSIAKAMAPYIG